MRVTGHIDTLGCLAFCRRKRGKGDSLPRLLETVRGWQAWRWSASCRSLESLGWFCPPDTSRSALGGRPAVIVAVAGWRRPAQYPRERPPVPARRHGGNLRRVHSASLPAPAHRHKIGGDKRRGRWTLTVMPRADPGRGPCTRSAHLHSRFGGGVGGAWIGKTRSQPGGKVNDPPASPPQRQRWLDAEENTPFNVDVTSPSNNALRAFRPAGRIRRAPALLIEVVESGPRPRRWPARCRGCLLRRERPAGGVLRLSKVQQGDWPCGPGGT